jgi:RNase H-like domain found in reverse transcriptase/Reverse transcriptase (RNA-dependent DNA polymerase)/Integrase zinc binding domain/Chromo (CHRromatin Organisation MOdifier) domain
LEIKIREGAKVPRCGQRPFNREEALEAKKQLDELIKKGKVRTSRSGSAAPTLFVKKADGSKRWCMDLRRLNEITLTDSNQAPLQETARERLKGAKYFTRLDMRDGYHHIRIKAGDEHKTAFLTEYGLYEWTVMCFGLKNAPAEFARYMNDILHEHLNDFVVIYFDDIVIFSDTIEEHWNHVRKVLQKLKEKRINLKLSKCEFAVTETKYLGHVVNGEGTRMQEEKLKAILEWPTPEENKDIEEFRGLAGYYRQYVDRFSKKMEPLNERIRSGIFDWKQEEEKAFRDVKEAFRKNEFLILPDTEKQFWVHADASDYAIGAEISQLDKNGKRRPVLFYSRKLLPAERNYTTADKEMLAIFQTLKKYRHLLQGTKLPVIVRSDHKNLRTFMTTKELNGRQARWAEELSEYNFRIEHVKGKENIVADALSRRPDHREKRESEKTQLLIEEEGALIVNPQCKIGLIRFENTDQDLMTDIKEKAKKCERTDLQENGQGFKTFKGLIYVAKDSEQKLLQRFHNDIREGHPGVDRTVEKIQREFYFPGMYRKIRKYIKNCDSCQRNKNDYNKKHGYMILDEDKPSRPWEVITADFLEMPTTTDAQGIIKLNELLVVTDKFSKQVVLIPTRKEADTDEVYEALWEKVFSFYGIPRRIISDRDKIFRTTRWRTLMNEIGSEPSLSTAKHQQTDGQTERKIQELRAYLRHYLDFDQKNWRELTPMAQFAANDARNATTGESPMLITCGYERTIGDKEKETGETTKWVERMKNIHRQVKLDIDWQEAETKKYYDRKRSKAEELNVNDRVYLRRRTTGEKTYNIRTERTATKLDAVKLGPFIVEEIQAHDNVKLRLPERMRVHPVFHRSLLVKTNNPEFDGDVACEEYEVDRLINKRKVEGVTEYLVRWKGFTEEDDSWEPTKNLHCPDLVKEFEKNFRSKPTKRQVDGEATAAEQDIRKPTHGGTLRAHRTQGDGPLTRDATKNSSDRERYNQRNGRKSKTPHKVDSFRDKTYRTGKNESQMQGRAKTRIDGET